jgi:hypothetical protein
MPTLSYKDSINRLQNNIINSNTSDSIFGNPLIISLLIVIIMLFIVHSNADNIIVQFMYSFIFTLSIILYSNTIIKNKYISRKNNPNIFDDTDVTANNKNPITPRTFNLNDNITTKGSSQVKSGGELDGSADIRDFLQLSK